MEYKTDNKYTGRKMVDMDTGEIINVYFIKTVKQQEREKWDKEYLHLQELLKNATYKTEKDAIKRAMWSMEVE